MTSLILQAVCPDVRRSHDIRGRLQATVYRWTPARLRREYISTQRSTIAVVFACSGFILDAASRHERVTGRDTLRHESVAQLRTAAPRRNVTEDPARAWSKPLACSMPGPSAGAAPKSDTADCRSSVMHLDGQRRSTKFIVTIYGEIKQVQVSARAPRRDYDTVFEQAEVLCATEAA